MNWSPLLNVTLADKMRRKFPKQLTANTKRFILLKLGRMDSHRLMQMKKYLQKLIAEKGKEYKIYKFTQKTHDRNNNIKLKKEHEWKSKGKNTFTR